MWLSSLTSAVLPGHSPFLNLHEILSPSTHCSHYLPTSRFLLLNSLLIYCSQFLWPTNIAKLPILILGLFSMHRNYPSNILAFSPSTSFLQSDLYFISVFLLRTYLKPWHYPHLQPLHSSNSINSSF